MTGRLAAVRIGAVVVAFGLVFAGCTVDQPGGDPGSSASAIWPTPVSSSPSPSATSSHELTDDELYQLAVEQYRSLFVELTDVEQNGGAPQLPDVVGKYLIDPAWSAYNEFYSIMYERGDRYTNKPDCRIISVAAWHSDKTPHDSVTAIQTCELSQGAALVTATGEVIADESPTIMHRWAYFKYDPADNQLKVFILNGEVVDTCPID